MWGNPPQRMLAGAPTGNTSNPQLSFDWVLRPLPQSCRIANSDTEVLKVRSARGTCSMDILVAEADAGLAAAYRQFLAHNGFDVTTAVGGLHCLALLRDRIPAVVALDLDLLWGGADGVLEHLREQRSRRRVPAVILTGQVPEEQLPAELLASPVVRYLCKP